MRRPASVDPAALDQFVVDLVTAGFKPDATGYVWTGPIDPSLSDLTDAKTMEVALRDGWPFFPPYVHADGIRPGPHLQERLLCLWRVGDESLQWLRLADLRGRITEWAGRYRLGATADDPVLDPNMYWRSRVPILAVVDLQSIAWGDGGSGELRATWTGRRIEIGNEGPLRVRWYARAGLREEPVDLEALSQALKAAQQRNLGRELEVVGQPEGLRLLMLIWQSPAGEPNILTLGLARGADGSIQAQAYETARTDTEVLIRRAGPDAEALRAKSVIVFGCGAIGSHISLLLARSCIGQLTLVDGEVLRPGDIIRHAVAREFVGENKATATSLSVQSTAPWTEVHPHEGQVWNPEALAEMVADVDLVVDATGEPAFTEQLSRVVLGARRSALSAALYRGGDVARIRLYAPGAVPWHARTPEAGYPVIPPPDHEPPPTWETGCGAPINNAPPVSVAAAAGLAARAAIDVLTGRETASLDLIDVYRPFGDSPFDRAGLSRFG